MTSDTAREAVWKVLVQTRGENVSLMTDAAIQAYESALTSDDLRRLAAKHGIALVSEGAIRGQGDST